MKCDLYNTVVLRALGRLRVAPVVQKGLVEDKQLNKKPDELPFIKEQPSNVFEQVQGAQATPLMKEELPTNVFWLMSGIDLLQMPLSRL
jgi:hypothetical protein